MSTPIVRVQEKGQVTIPLEIRQRLNLKKGDLVTFVETDEGVLIRPVEVLVASALDEIGRELRESGVDMDELLERIRLAREELIAKEYNLGEPSSQ